MTDDQIKELRTLCEAAAKEPRQWFGHLATNLTRNLPALLDELERLRGLLAVENSAIINEVNTCAAAVVDGLRAGNARLTELLDEWKASAMLTKGGDPDAITPADNEANIAMLTKHARELEEAVFSGHPMTVAYTDSLQSLRCQREERDRLRADKARLRALVERLRGRVFALEVTLAEQGYDFDEDGL